MTRGLKSVIASCALALGACAQQPALHPIGFPSMTASADTYEFPFPGHLAQNSEDEETLEERARRVFQNTAPPSGNLPDAALDQELLFKFLLSEIAGQRGNVQLSAQGYLEMARSTRDPRLARRATEIASYARLQGTALDAARLWFELEPDSQQARQSLVGLLLSANKLGEVKPHLEALLASGGKPAQGFLQLHGLLNKHPDKEAVFNVVKDLAGRYQDLPEAHLVLAQSASAAGKHDLAINAMRAAMKLRPDWELGALQYSQFIQQRESAAKAAEYLTAFVQAHPDAKDVRAHLARMLINAKQLTEARAQYQILQEAQPDNPDILVTIGLLSLQLDDFELADTSLRRALELNYRDPDTLRFYIGQAYEERKRPDEAMHWYAQVKGGDQYVPAQARYAFLLGRQNKLAEARTYLQNVQVANEEQRTVLIQAEAQLLRESRAYQESYDVLADALARQPENVDLLYDSALAAEKLSRLDVVESNLRKLIELKPDHAQAYNALGYTLADRTKRYSEAKEYIERALALLPDDAFILDSMGWVHYRLGNFKEALDFLQRAYGTRPDPEIAAHLGEVMWAQGKTVEAEQLWRSALVENADNELLQQTVKRFLR